jgi:hypothetical protein
MIKRLALGVLPLVLVGGVAVYTLGQSARSVAFNGDEGNYICTSYYFQYLFVDHDVNREEWDANYWTRTQPMLERYLVGGWLWFRGYDITRMRAYCEFDWALTIDENRARGYVPSSDLVAEARTPMVLVGSLAVLGMYGLGRALGGLLAGLAASAFTLASPLAQQYLVQALPEPQLAASISFFLLIAVLGIRRGRAGDLPLLCAIVAGLVTGLGVAAKLTGVLSLLTIGAWSLAVAATALRFRPRGGAFRSTRLGLKASKGCLLTLSLGIVVFLVSDPFLYRNPLRNTGAMFAFRAREMREQQRDILEINPEYGLADTAVYSPVEQARRVLDGSLVQGTFTGSHGVPIELGLSAIGVWGLCSSAWIGLRSKLRLSPEAFMVLALVTFFGAITAGLLVAWPRYFLPTLLLGSVCSAMGLVHLGHLAAGARRRLVTASRN